MQNFLAAQGSLRKRFSMSFEFPDYTCEELAKIFIDLCYAKGFELDGALTVGVLSKLLDRETTPEWRAERNGRVCELLLSGARTEVRRRIRSVTFEEVEVDPESVEDARPQRLVEVRVLIGRFAGLTRRPPLRLCAREQFYSEADLRPHAHVARVCARHPLSLDELRGVLLERLVVE